MDNGYKNLKVNQLAHELAMKIFHLTKKFPKEEHQELYSNYQEVGKMF